MSLTTDLLDSAKAAQGLVSDYALARLLGVTPSVVSNWRCGVSFPCNDSALRLGALAGVTPALAMVDVNIDRTSRSEKDRAAWREVGRAILGESSAFSA